MAITSTVNLALSVSGAGISEQYVPPGFPFINATAPAGGVIATVLAAGDNTLTIPVGSVYLLIVPPASSTNGKKLQSTTGFPINAANPSLVGLAAAATTVVINSVGIETVTLLWM